jgi:hypothetical protein
VHVLHAQFLQGGPHPVRCCNQGCNINPLAGSGYMLQVPGATLQKTDGPSKVSVSPVVQRHRNLDDALIKISGLTFCSDPEIFHGFVAFKPVTSVEFPDALQELTGGGIVTGSRHGYTSKETGFSSIVRSSARKRAA